MLVGVEGVSCVGGSGSCELLWWVWEVCEMCWWEWKVCEMCWWEWKV